MGPLIRRYWREICFAVAALAALALSGRAELAGLPVFVVAITPGLEAQAQDVPHGGSMRVALTGFAASRHAPQILYPVVARALPDWLRQPAQSAGTPLIAICIDDLGGDIAATESALHLPKEVALSFLPFAPTTPGFALRAREEGHVVLAHVPMQALGGTNPGPMALDVGMTPDEIARRLAWALERVPGAVGVNNHEGSRFTSDEGALAPVMAMLKARGLFFFDSRTSGGSRGETAAKAAGVSAVGRDVFLDDDQSEAAVRTQLNALVAAAKRQGVAVAIGHPHATTLRLLKTWLAEEHGVKLVSLPEAMRTKAGRAVASNQTKLSWSVATRWSR
ncbi:MAG: divergent polysaccharide deacetylase family protein [Alphaproteobacteria bacterium]|nr:divergent polysaccharide deacetylase family protein [Alphaproteobacteria bacterium]